MAGFPTSKGPLLIVAGTNNITEARRMQKYPVVLSCAMLCTAGLVQRSELLDSLRDFWTRNLDKFNQHHTSFTAQRKRLA